MQGTSPARAVLTVPLFFGLAHLHHLHDLVVHRGERFSDAAMLVRLHACCALKIPPPIVLVTVECGGCMVW